ncbi:MAG: NAD(P)/FAD-dependent oxidoreductase, partial [Erysipelotrichaceae bacterium]
DVIIVGAGIIGSLIAKNLSKYQLKVLLLEKNNDVANEATSANSAIVHTGHDPADDTLKATFNVKGAKMYPTLCEELDCEIKYTGAYVVAKNEEELNTLDILYDRALSRNIEVSYVDKETILKQEPNLSDAILKGISLPTTAVITPWEIAISAVELAMDNGVELSLNTEVLDVKKEDIFRVITKQKEYSSKIVINCAGQYADDIYKLVDPSSLLEIKAHKGEYFVIDQMKTPFVNHVIYPVPSSKGKGVLAVPTVHGNTLLGPNNVATNKGEVTTTKEGLGYLRDELNHTLNKTPSTKIIRTFAGLRPKGNLHDFVIEESKVVEGFINVAAIESPGIASAPAIGEYVVNQIVAKRLTLKPKDTYQNKVRKKIRLKSYSYDELQSLAKADPKYSNIVCRCEQITEGEIIDVIHRNCGAKTIKGVKKRVRPGMGRCQGGFCQPFIVDILARELKIDKTKVLYDELQSEILISNEKGEL